MCLLFGMTHTHRMTRRQINAVLRTTNAHFASSQPDGFGFSLQNLDGTRYTERYVDPAQFAGMGIADRAKKAAPANVAGGIMVETTGEYRNAGGGLLVHGRTSTGTVSLENTHPFTKNGWTLAHNGVVDWRGMKHPLETTCDSEHILNMFALGNGVADTNKLSGYAACLMLDPQNRFVVFKDDTAPLVCCYIAQLESTLFASREYIITAVLKTLRIRAKYTFAVERNTLLTFPLIAGDKADYTIVPHSGLSWGYTGTGAACRAFGGAGAWGGDDYDYHSHYHRGAAPKRVTVKATNAADVLGLEEGEDKTATKAQDKQDLDLLDEDAWRHQVESLRARGEYEEAKTLETYLEEELAEQQQEHERARQTKSLHTMTDEELERYGL